MASIYMALISMNQNMIRLLAKDPPHMEPVTVSEVLKSWALPAMAEAQMTDEKEFRAREEFERFKRLAERLNGK